MKTIYALGPEGTNGHEAAAKVLVTMPDAELQFCDRNSMVLERAQSEDAYGVVPIENFSAGLVTEVVKDFWMQGSATLHVIGEVELPIHHCLATRKDTDLDRIKKILSHPQALQQCSTLLNEREWIRLPASSTAEAARLVSQDPDNGDTAVIASPFAAARYGLHILQDEIADHPGNATRFHVVGPNGLKPTGKDKTPIVFELPDVVGALLRVLQIIGGLGVNMSSLHSIPLGRQGSVAFYCELDCHAEDERGKPLLEGIRTFVPTLKVLGSYQIGRY
ncbi:hypothetical protein GF380_01305 [Candidatus Uhrbacteria bacterium]|nr:hypothetical protein [Candidatus Uhrbacteria bacterium]MBD3283921.1 hypothetical protein [Candidatus Uhrbacteria bacterium]